jgi:hypothetical protein
VSTFTVIGTVPDFTGREFLMPIDNEAEFSAWLRTNGVDTSITMVRNKPTAKIRGSLAAECHPGSRICYTIEAVDRRDGRRIRGIKVEPF